jgi:hypothetical protein
MASWKHISLGWLAGAICGFLSAYGIAHDTQWWSGPLIFLALPSGMWLLFGSIITLVALVDSAEKRS